MTNRRLFDRIIGRVPTISRYISLGILACLTLAASPTLQISDARVSATDNGSAIPGKWYTFTSPDGDFSLTFPRKPILQDVSDGPLTVIRHFSSTLENGMNFSINFHDIGGDPKAHENNEWPRNQEELSSAADRNEGRRMVQMRRLAKNVIEAEVWQNVPEAAGANINYLRRSILWRARIYTLACGWVVDGREIDKPTCGKFFNSMRFITRPTWPAQRRLK